MEGEGGRLIPDEKKISAATAAGFMLCLSSFSYMWLMKSRLSDVFLLIYTLHVMDGLMGLSLFYAGFHGSFVSASTDDNTVIRPVNCLYSAAHLSLWSGLDVANAALLLLFCVDQNISIIWTRTHKVISSIYLQPFIMALIFFASFAVLRFAWQYPLENASNSTIVVSPFCTFCSVVGEDIYSIDLYIRLLSPLAGLALLFVAALILLCYQIAQEWQFKWSDNNKESVSFYNFALIRCVLSAVSIYVPIWFLKDPELDELDEVWLRAAFAVFISILQPLWLLWTFPQYGASIRLFFSKYSHNTKRTWQSTDDPPDDRNIGSVGLDFGSWYSSGGNIIGECGIPYEMNADKQRSVSFYYNEMEKY